MESNDSPEIPDRGETSDRTASTLGLSILYVYVFRECCVQFIMYPGSEQPVVKIERLWLTYDEVKSGIGDHRTSLDAQPSSWKK